MSAARPAVFFDRDGVLNRLVWRDGGAVSPRALANFTLYDDAAPAAAAARAAGFRVFVITNQPDIARGGLDRAELERMHDRLREAIRPDDIAFCPHTDMDACDCRKPKPGMIRALAARWNVDLGASWVVGDTWRDVGAGHAAGCRTILLVREEGGGDAGDAAEADARVSSLQEAIAYIKSQSTG